MSRIELDPSLIHTCTPGLSQEASADDLGFGNLYYALVRMLRPRHVLVIGSGYGFSPAIMALALRDNGLGHLSFVDPSMDGDRDGLNSAHGGTGQWDTPEAAAQHFSCAGVPTGIVTHYKETNQQFFSHWAERGLPPIDLALIDGAHDEGNASYDLAMVMEHLQLPAYVLMHDVTHFLNRTGHMGVTAVLERAVAAGAESVVFPGTAGLALLRIKERIGVEIQLAPPSSVVWPVASVLLVAVGIGIGIGTLLADSRNSRA